MNKVLIRLLQGAVLVWLGAALMQGEWIQFKVLPYFLWRPSNFELADKADHAGVFRSYRNQPTKGHSKQDVLYTIASHEVQNFANEIRGFNDVNVDYYDLLKNTQADDVIFFASTLWHIRASGVMDRFQKEMEPELKQKYGSIVERQMASPKWVMSEAVVFDMKNTKD